MPDFDTRKPQEPDQPNRLHMFVVASRQYMSAVGRWRPRMPRHPYRWALGMSLLPLLVVAVATMPSAVEKHLAYKLDKDVELKPTPAYHLMDEDPLSRGSSAGDDCELDYAEHGYSGYGCFYVKTEATDAVTLASITHEVLSSRYAEGAQVEFSRSEHDWYSGDPQAISYCFDSKNTAVSAGGLVLYQAELLGKIDSCYIAVYTPYVYVFFGARDPPPPPTASVLLAAAGILLILLVCSAVLLVVLLRIQLLLTENSLNRLGTGLNRLRTVLMADWLRTAWIALGVLLFVMVVVPGALLIYHYSGIGD